MTDDNVISMAEATQDSTRWTPGQMLQEAVSMCEETRPNKAVVLLLDTTNEGYDFSFAQSNMSYSQIISLLEIVKHELTARILHGE